MNFSFYPSSYYFRGAIKWLIITNIGVFVIEMFAGVKFLEVFGLMPVRVTKGLWLWQMFTYMFLHGGFFHLVINLFVLWMFGRAIENVWGSSEFLRYYFICGLGAALLTILSGPFARTISIGASGAVYGILLAFAMLFPDEMIYLYFFIPMRAKHFVIFLGVMAFLSSLSSPGGGVAHLAHLGGLLTGYIYLKYPTGRRRFYLKFSKIKDFFRRRDRGKYHGAAVDEDRVNQILDKILLNGVESLTPDEERIMQEYVKNKETKYEN
jgi:membrane associated rhomboid family serine protease